MGNISPSLSVANDERERTDDLRMMKYCFFKNVQHRSWSSVEQAVASNPVLAAQRDALGCTTLHMTCSLDPPASTLRVLVRAYPEAAAMRDGRGRSPLHVAVAHGAESAVRILTEFRPAAVTERDDSGRTPLHHVLSRHAAATATTTTRRGPDDYGHHRAFPWGTFRTLLKESDRASVVEGRDACGHTPLRLAWESYRSVVPWNEEDLEERRRTEWHKIEALLETASTDDSHDALRVASGIVDCPADLFRVLADRHFDPADHTERPTPLSLAASRDFIEETDDAKATVVELSKRCPFAATVACERTGRRPLHEALARGRTWERGGAKELFAAWPEISRTNDPVSGLPTFSLPTLASKEKEKDDDMCDDDNDDDSVVRSNPDDEEEERVIPKKKKPGIANDDAVDPCLYTMYELLRADPSVLQRYCPP